MSELAEIKGLVEEINPVLIELRKEVEELKSRDLADVVTQEKHDKMAAHITGQVEALQAAQTKMEAALKRPGANGNDAEVEEKQAKEFNDFLRKGVDPAGKQSGKFALEVKNMSTDVNPDGGYLVRPQFVDKVVTRVFETSPMRQIADVIKGSAKSIEMLVDDDEADANRVGEGASSGETDTPEIGMKVIAAHKYDATPKVTTEMLADSVFDVENWLGGKVSRKIARMENYDFVQGNGVLRARGFLTYDAWASAGVYEADKIEQVNMGNASAVTSDGFIDLQNSLIEDYQPGAVWAMHRTTFGAALQLKGSDNYFFSPVLLRDGQATLQVLGRPVMFMNDMPSVAANALAVAYGDFSMGYTIYDREGIIVLRDPYSAHGFVSYYTTKRTGGDVTSFDSIKIGKIAA